RGGGAVVRRERDALIRRRAPAAQDRDRRHPVSLAGRERVGAELEQRFVVQDVQHRRRLRAERRVVGGVAQREVHRLGRLGVQVVEDRDRDGRRGLSVGEVQRAGDGGVVFAGGGGAGAGRERDTD